MQVIIQLPVLAEHYSIYEVQQLHCVPVETVLRVPNCGAPYLLWKWGSKVGPVVRQSLRESVCLTNVPQIKLSIDQTSSSIISVLQGSCSLSQSWEPDTHNPSSRQHHSRTSNLALARLRPRAGDRLPGPRTSARRARPQAAARGLK